MDSEGYNKTPLFFKFILEDTLTHGRLEIPTGFVIEFGNCLRNPVIYLEGPNGKKWEVVISNNAWEEEVWLAKGWVEFSENHSLKNWDLLSFEYKGDFNFNVVVFDRSLTQIQYPGFYREMMNKHKETTAPISMDVQHIQKDNGGNVGSSSGSRIEVDTTSKSNATNFNSSNPWFEIVLNSSYELVIPFSFMEEHMECERQTIMLKVEDNSWHVNFSFFPYIRKAGLYHGFPSFVRDNYLKAGDVCVFELISKNVFNVHIFGDVSSSKVDTANFTPSNPRFEIVVESIQYLEIPYSFWEKHMDSKTKTVTLKVGYKSSWHVILSVSPDIRAASIHCLATFLREHGLRKGDLCVFELIGKNAFNVHIRTKPKKSLL